ncbi:hypothetical protein BDZ91DRAFT_768330 [Kalaharituber pfeilii]|nr:hypothetical protein BDZ91DRAFT_768330 [Kalaharituber pfeilii]
MAEAIVGGRFPSVHATWRITVCQELEDRGQRKTRPNEASEEKVCLGARGLRIGQWWTAVAASFRYEARSVPSAALASALACRIRRHPKRKAAFSAASLPLLCSAPPSSLLLPSFPPSLLLCSFPSFIHLFSPPSLRLQVPIVDLVSIYTRLILNSSIKNIYKTTSKFPSYPSPSTEDLQLPIWYSNLVDVTSERTGTTGRAISTNKGKRWTKAKMAPIRRVNAPGPPRPPVAPPSPQTDRSAQPTTTGNARLSEQAAAVPATQVEQAEQQQRSSAVSGQGQPAAAAPQHAETKKSAPRKMQFVFQPMKQKKPPVMGPQADPPGRLNFSRVQPAPRRKPSLLTRMISSPSTPVMAPVPLLGLEPPRRIVLPGQGPKPRRFIRGKLRRLAVRIREPAATHPRAVRRRNARPTKSILKKTRKEFLNEGQDQQEHGPSFTRPSIFYNTGDFVYEPTETPIMQNHRAITTVSIPKFVETKRRTGLLSLKWQMTYGANRGRAPDFGQRKQKWARSAFLSQCGQFVILHEFPIFSGRGSSCLFGNRIMNQLTSEKSKIVIYRTYGKLQIWNEDLPQPEYGRVSHPVNIPGGAAAYYPGLGYEQALQDAHLVTNSPKQIHHTGCLWPNSKIDKIKSKHGFGQLLTDKASHLPRSHDKATLFLVKGAYGRGDAVQVSGSEVWESHYTFQSAHRKADVTLTLDRALPIPHSRRPDVRVTQQTRARYRSGPSRQQEAAGEGDIRDEDTMLLDEEQLRMNLADGQVTAVAIEYAIKQIAFGGMDVVQVYHILPKAVCDCIKHSHRFFGACRKPHVGVFIPDRLVPTWTLDLQFIPRTILMAPLPTKDRAIVDQVSKTVILPWYNTIYRPLHSRPIRPVDENTSTKFKETVPKEWPMYRLKPWNPNWLNMVFAPESYAASYRLSGYIDWNGELHDRHLYRWYDANPLMEPVGVFGHVSYHQHSDYPQTLLEWRDTVKLLPCLVITRAAIDDRRCFWSKNGIRRQELRCQLIFHDKEVTDGDEAGQFVNMDRYRCQSEGRLVPDAACDDVGDLNIKGKRALDGQRETLMVTQHVVGNLRWPNTFIVAALYEDNAIFLFEVYLPRGFEESQNIRSAWPDEICFFGFKLGNFGVNVPTTAGLGSVSGKVLGMAFDMRDWEFPGLSWPAEEPGVQMQPPCLRLKQPSGLALVLLVDGEGKGETQESEIMKEDVLPSTTMSGGLQVNNLIEQELAEQANVASREASPEAATVSAVSQTNHWGPLGEGPPSALVTAGPSRRSTIDHDTSFNVEQSWVAESDFVTSSESDNPGFNTFMAGKTPPVRRVLSQKPRRGRTSPAFEGNHSSCEQDSKSNFRRTKSAPAFINIDPGWPVPRADSDLRDYLWRRPQKPRFLTHTIHLYQGHIRNLNVGGPSVQDSRGANWEYVGVEKERYGFKEALRDTGKGVHKLFSKITGNWKGYNQRWLNHGLSTKERVSEEELERSRILHRGGKWDEGEGFRRYKGRKPKPGEGLGVMLRKHVGPGGDLEERDDLDIYGGDQAVGSMGVAGDIGMGRVMGESKVIPELGVGAYRPVEGSAAGALDSLHATKGPMYNKRTYQYKRKKTTAEMARETEKRGKLTVQERILREREMATEKEIVGKLEDIDAPGVEEDELQWVGGRTNVRGTGNDGTGFVQLAPSRGVMSAKAKGNWKAGVMPTVEEVSAQEEKAAEQDSYEDEDDDDGYEDKKKKDKGKGKAEWVEVEDLEDEDEILPFWNRNWSRERDGWDRSGGGSGGGGPAGLAGRCIG